MPKFQTFYEAEKVVGETYVPGTSETEPGQAVDIHSVYSRCLRGEALPNSPEFYYDRSIGVLEHPDSDLSDVAILNDVLAQKKAKDEEDKRVYSEVAPSKASGAVPSSASDEIVDGKEAS